jgi:hypothetical protein
MSVRSWRNDRKLLAEADYGRVDLGLVVSARAAPCCGLTDRSISAATVAELRKSLRPVLADVAETAQFLAIKRLVLNNEARDCFLDWLYEDLAEALRRLLRIADGDYSGDKYAERFPKFDGPDTGETPRQLFEAYRGERAEHEIFEPGLNRAGAPVTRRPLMLCKASLASITIPK